MHTCTYSMHRGLPCVLVFIWQVPFHFRKSTIFFGCAVLMPWPDSSVVSWVILQYSVDALKFESLIKQIILFWIGLDWYGLDWIEIHALLKYNMKMD